VLIPAEVRLCAIDWGTSSARAYLLDRHGDIVAQRHAPLGIQNICDGEFARALATLCEDAPAGVPRLACGMIGSRQGWIEAPYQACPADIDALATSLARVDAASLAIVPGLRCDDAHGAPDVMRGEETQIVGVLDESASDLRVLVLPGTHSKWVLCRGDRIEAFVTFMSGEIFAVLRQHSILGRMIAPGEDAAAFGRGVSASLRDHAALTHDLFTARTLALTGMLEGAGVADYLSGLIIGAEFAAGARWLASRAPASALTIVGEAALAARYRAAATVAGFTAHVGAETAAARGLWRIARRAGMLAP
jgi:2-dehydro-3-deoxygalactonokinase